MATGTASAGSVKYSARGTVGRHSGEERRLESSVVLWYHKTRATLQTTVARKERRREKSQVGVVEELRETSHLPQ